jgi:gas vesicle protein
VSESGNQAERDGTEGLISLLAGVGVGVIVGGAIALLLAPQTGAQTRAQIRESADDALGRLRESMDDLKVKVEEIAGSARQAVANRQGGGGSDIGDGVADAVGAP